MSNFSTFFPAGGGGEGAGINSYAPYSVSSTGNPVGYDASTGLYTNPVDDSVWLKSGEQIVETSPRTYPNATSLADMFIPGGVPVRITAGYPVDAIVWHNYTVSGTPTDYLFVGEGGTCYQMTYDPAGNSGGGQYNTISSSPTHSGLGANAFVKFTFHVNSGRWYDRGTSSNVAMMTSYTNGGPRSHTGIVTYDMATQVGQGFGYAVQPLFTRGNFLYVTNTAYNDVWEYNLDATTGDVLSYNNSTWNLTTTLGNGFIRDLQYDPIGNYVYFQGSNAGSELLRLDPTTLASTGYIYPTVQNANDNGIAGDVYNIAFGKIGATNVLWLQGFSAASYKAGQFYSQASDFSVKVGDITAKTDASGSAQPLFIKLK
jgi:hypothetical protein